MPTDAEIQAAAVAVWGEPAEAGHMARLALEAAERVRFLCATCQGKGWSELDDEFGEPIPCPDCEGTGLNLELVEWVCTFDNPQCVAPDQTPGPFDTQHDPKNGCGWFTKRQRVVLPDS